MDSICSRRCRQYDPTCESSNSAQASEDRVYSERYGLKIGIPYESGEILRRLREVDGAFMFELF